MPALPIMGAAGHQPTSGPHQRSYSMLLRLPAAPFALAAGKVACDVCRAAECRGLRGIAPPIEVCAVQCHERVKSSIWTRPEQGGALQMRGGAIATV